MSRKILQESSIWLDNFYSFKQNLYQSNLEIWEVLLLSIPLISTCLLKYCCNSCHLPWQSWLASLFYLSVNSSAFMLQWPFGSGLPSPLPSHSLALFAGPWAGSCSEATASSWNALFSVISDLLFLQGSAQPSLFLLHGREWTKLGKLCSSSCYICHLFSNGHALSSLSCRLCFPSIGPLMPSNFLCSKVLTR